MAGRPGTGADLLWRVRKNIVLPVLRACADGSYLTEISRPATATGATRLRVRVIEYTLGRAATRPSTGSSPPSSTRSRPRPPNWPPSTPSAGSSSPRWTRSRPTRAARHLVLRSQHPDGAEQEIYGFLLVHHAIRDLMHQAARAAGLDPDRISFTRTLRVVRRQVTDQAAFSPSRLARALTHTWLNCSNGCCRPARRRSNPRVIKRKMSNWPPQTRPPPQPTPTTPNTVTLMPPTKPTSRRQKDP